jgi:hypothetical protein
MSLRIIGWAALAFHLVLLVVVLSGVISLRAL